MKTDGFRMAVNLGLFVVLCVCLCPLLPGAAHAVSYDYLINELQRDDWERVILSPDRLKSFKDDKLFRDLVNVADNRGLDWRIRIRGIKTLGALKTSAALSNLVAMFNDPFFNAECPSIKSYVAEALGNYNDLHTVDTLIDGLTDAELLVRESSIKSLGKIASPKALPHLVKLLNDNSLAVKISAIYALERIGDRLAVPYLQRFIDATTDSFLKETALRVINSIR